MDKDLVKKAIRTGVCLVCFFAIFIADKIVVISNGEIDTVGTRDEILPKLLSQSDTYQFHKVREQQ